jgi:hypothetical protein
MWDMKTSVTQGQDRLVSIGQVRQVRLHTKERTARPGYDRNDRRGETGELGTREPEQDS